MRELLGQHIITGDGLSRVDFSKIISMNDTAAWLWEQLQGKEFSEDDIVRLIDKEVTGIGFQNSLQSPYLVFEKLTKVINTDTDFFGYLLGMNANVSLESKIADLLKSKFKLFVLQDVEISELRLNLMAEFIISGMVAVYRRWFNSDRSEPIETISKEMQLLAFEGIKGFLGVAL